MLVMLALLFGCSDMEHSEPGVAFPNKFDLDECIELNPRFVDFGESYPGESMEPVRLTLVDKCGVLNYLEWELDDPDNAFDVDYDGASSVVVQLVTDVPGEWEAQWRSVLSDIDLKDQVQGSVDIQLFATVLSDSE